MVPRKTRLGSFRSATNYQRLDSDALELSYCLVPWDTRICGFNVAQIDENIVILDPEKASQDFGGFLDWCSNLDVTFCSCRMPVAKIKESILLQEKGFYFVEQNYQPYLKNIQEIVQNYDEIEIKKASNSDVDQIAKIAGRSFSAERFHFDPFWGLR